MKNLRALAAKAVLPLTKYFLENLRNMYMTKRDLEMTNEKLTSYGKFIRLAVSFSELFEKNAGKVEPHQI